MHSEGHAGSMLLLYAPFAFMLAYIGEYVYLGIGFMLLGTMPMVPDIDMKLPIKHRGWTHTIWFAIFLGVMNVIIVSAIYFYSGRIPQSEFYPLLLFGFFVGNMWVFGHLIGDYITPMGIKILYPLRKRSYRAKFLFFPVRASNEPANYIFMVLGTVIFFLSVGAGLYFGAHGF